MKYKHDMIVFNVCGIVYVALMLMTQLTRAQITYGLWHLCVSLLSCNPESLSQWLHLTHPWHSSCCSTAQGNIPIIHKFWRDPCREEDNGGVHKDEDGCGDARCDEYAR